ncbi:protein-disulfide reductase DsbD family protein [Psychromonas sp.]|nr:protein-disulfide reductase DsbD family protein [Psychromonas sp.]
MYIFKYPLLSFLLLFIFTSNTFAQSIETGWIDNPNHPPVQVNLQLTGQSNPEEKTVNALLNVNLEGDWKTYWRSPGEGGVAPKFKWPENSTNIKAVDWSWPTPKRYPFLGVDTVGYKGKLHIPIAITVEDPTKPSHLQGILTIASCTSICVLTDYNIDLTFDMPTLESNDEIAFAYAQAMSSVPILVDQNAIDTQKNNVNITQFVTSWDQLNQQVVVQVSNKIGWKSPDLFIDSFDPELGDVFFSKPEISVSDKQLTAIFNATSWADDVNLDKANVNITLVDNNVAVELPSTLGNQVIEQSSESIVYIFFVAMLGGLILNIMPCVLPVLGMKLSSVLGVDSSQRSQIRMQFLASSAGILTSFWMLASFLLVLKFSGEALGWGIQFQNPYFIAVMVVITGVFAANMLGIFEIQLPSSMQTWLATTGGNSYVGHYLQGMFATLLATPCSAPFLGTAVAFALGASPWELFAIFTALGLGMALPWLLIAAFPSIASLMPKPGNWMGTVKNFFALLILVTCLWLVSLLSSFIGELYTGIIALVILLVFAVLIIKKYGIRAFGIAFSVLLIITAIGFIIMSLTSSNSLKDEIVWTPLDSQVIEQSIAEGKVVFVDVTADWCVTCKANKVGVLLQDPVYSALQESDVVTMKGDWTVRSDSVTAYLQSFGRYGVPFNIVYGPAAPNGIELSTILNNDDVLNALKKAKGQ